MNRKNFLKISAAGGLLPLMNTCDNAGSNPLITMNDKLSPKMSSPILANSFWYIGHLMSVLISSRDTNGAFSLIHGFEIQGLEPPPHIHTKEDESFYLINGAINYTVGEQSFNATAGDWVFLPRNIQHSFQVITETAEVLIHLTPGGFEHYFMEMSVPAEQLVNPPKPQGPPDIEKIVATASKFGIIFPPH